MTTYSPAHGEIKREHYISEKKSIQELKHTPMLDEWMRAKEESPEQVQKNSEFNRKNWEAEKSLTIASEGKTRAEARAGQSKGQEQAVGGHVYSHFEDDDSQSDRGRLTQWLRHLCM